MSQPIDRRTFATAFTASVVLGAETVAAETPAAPSPHPLPMEAPFVRDYPVPEFRPSWKRPQINRQLVQDFVIYAHMDLDLVKQLLEREPGLLHSHMDWGGGDFESALGAASHMGRRDIAEYLLGRGARLDLFCAAMLGQLEVVRGILSALPALIEAKGPHGIGLHLHAKMGGAPAAATLDYLQSLKKVELPNFKK